MNDQELLTACRAEQSPEAFAELVRRYARVVYSAARRQVRDTALAEDVTQAVFLLLWQKAGRIGRADLLAGWLLRATWYASRRAMTQQARREHHEKQAAAMRTESVNMDDEPMWTDYAPEIDAAMAKLGDVERSAVALRYLCGMSLREVGEAMQLSEEAARKRVDRGMTKLRGLLGKEAAVPTVAGLAAALVANGTEAAPPMVVSGVMAAATGSASTAVTGLAKSVGRVMAWTKVKVAMVILAAVGIVGGTGVAAASARVAKSATAPAGPPFALAAAPGDESHSVGNVMVYGYSVGVEDPVAQQLRAGRTAAPGAGSYQLYLADVEEIRGLLLREMAAGNVLPVRGDNLSMTLRDLERPLELGGFGASLYNSSSAHWGIAANALFGPGSQVSLDPAGTVSLRGNLLFRRISAADPQWRGAERDLSDVSLPLSVAIAPGQAAMAILDLGSVGNAKRSHVVVFAPMRLSREESAAVGEMDYPETYLRLGLAGIRQVSSYSQQWKVAATQPANPAPASKWEQKLSDGTTIRLAAIGRPRRWPTLMWNPDGNPTAFSCGWPDHDPTGGQHSSAEGTTLRIEVSSPHPIGYGLNQMPTPLAANRYGGYQQASWNDAFSSVGVRMGVGPWQSAGIIKAGQTYTLGDTRVRIESIEQNGGQVVKYRVLDGSEKCLTFATVSKTGERQWAWHCDYAFMNGPGLKRRLEPERFTYQAHVSLQTTPQPNNDPIELLWRNAETVHFDGFATQPVTLPPFDLAQDGRVPAKREPTRVTPTRPAAADTPAADMKRMLDAAARGDIAEVESYLTGSTPEKVKALARVITRVQQALAEFDRRYQKPLGGKVGEISAGIRRFADARLYALGDKDTASSGGAQFIKNAAGRWQTDLAAGDSAADMNQLQIASEVLEHWLESLKAGEYAEAEDAEASLEETLRAEMEARTKQ